MVEHNLAKVRVADSSSVSRSINQEAVRFLICFVPLKSNTMTITELTEFDKNVFIELTKLALQLDASSVQLTENRLKAVIESGNSHLFVALNDNGKVAGMLTVVSFHIPTGVKYRIEDVVVDETQRKQGIGNKLMNHAISFAAKSGAESIDLTSKPARHAANQLYLKLGFVKRETNVYRLVI